MADKAIAPYVQALTKGKDRFLAIAEKKPELGIDWATEFGYAVQRIKTDSSGKLATCPRDSICDAIVNVAATGLSLNPALKHAYLVPRDGRATLDISYMGLCHLAEMSGAIRYVRADVVREGDNFIWKGLDEKPVHEITDPFYEEGDDDRRIIGVYCYAMTSDGHYLAGKMSRKEIEKIRQTSKAPNSPAWKNWYGEMAKKSIIKREQKLWPKAARAMVGEAVRVLNESEGLETVGDFDGKQHYADVVSKSEGVSETNDVSDTNGKPDKQSQSETVIEGEFEEVSGDETPSGMSDSTQHIISKKLAACGLKEADLFKAMEVKDWSGLKQSDAAGCMDWINSEAAA